MCPRGVVLLLLAGSSFSRGFSILATRGLLSSGSSKLYPTSFARARSKRYDSCAANVRCLSGERSMSSSFGLTGYLERIGLHLPSQDRVPCHATLSAIMDAQSRAIPFENLDVVQRKIIAISPSDVEQKLVFDGRGGYCFEQNQLLASALLALKFDVSPMLCRVRWNKADDEQTTFTHVALAVKLGGVGSADGGPERTYLADVGFAGTNSIAPVLLGSEEPQSLPEGNFRTIRDDTGFTTLQWQIKDQWRSLYMFREEACLPIDLELANWWSCTYPKARFTSQFFVARVIGAERHHVLNEIYTVRKEDGSAESRRIETTDDLLQLLTTVFGITLPPDTHDLDRYLPQQGGAP